MTFRSPLHAGQLNIQMTQQLAKAIAIVIQSTYSLKYIAMAMAIHADIAIAGYTYSFTYTIYTSYSVSINPF